MDLTKHDISKFVNARSPRSLGGNYLNNLEIYARVHPIKVFDSDQFDDNTRKWVVRNFIDSKNPIKSVKLILSKYPSNRVSYFLWYLANFPHIAKKFEELYEIYNCNQIADYFGIDNYTIIHLYGDCYGSKMRNRFRSSKIHLQTKPIIESIIGPTVTEYRFHKWSFDEYSEKYNLDIEIDGEWCHDNDKDHERDEILLNTYNIKVFRIRAYTDPEIIKSELSNFIKIITDSQRVS